MRTVFNAGRDSKHEIEGWFLYLCLKGWSKEKCYKRSYLFDYTIHKILSKHLLSWEMVKRRFALCTLCLYGNMFFKISRKWIQLIVLAAKCQAAVERNTALQWWWAEAPGRKARAIKWKIPAEDVFPFLIWRKRVLFEACMSVENTENRGRWENDLTELGELKQTCSFSQSSAFLQCLRLNNKVPYTLYNCSQAPQFNMPCRKEGDSFTGRGGENGAHNNNSSQERPREWTCHKQHACVRFRFNCSLNTSRLMALVIYYSTNYFSGA